MAVQASGWISKVALALVGFAVAGLCAGLIAWGAVTTTQDDHERRLDKVETSAAARAVGQAKLEATQQQILDAIKDLKTLVQSRMRRDRHDR